MLRIEVIGLENQVKHVAEFIGQLKKQGLTLLKLTIAFCLIWWMAQKGFLDLGQVLDNFSWHHYFFAALILFFMISLNNWRWSLLLKNQNLEGGFWRVFPLTFIGLFFNFAVPGGVGGDVVKGYYLIRGKNEKRLAALLTILMDRLIGLWAMAFLALIGFLTNWELVRENEGFFLMMLSVGALVLGFAVFVGISFILKPERFRSSFSFLRKISQGHHLFSLYEAFHQYSRKPLVIFSSFVLSLASQMLAVLFIWFVGHMLEPDLAFMTYVFAVPIGFIAMALPISPAGVGVGQAALFFLFNAALGRSSQLGPNTMTVFQIALFLWSLIGAYYYIRKGQVSGEIESVRQPN